MKHSLVIALASLVLPVLIALPGRTQVSEGAASIRSVAQSVALQTAITLQIAPGRITAIQFQTDEYIQFAMLGSSAQITFTTNAPINTATSKILLLRQIEALRFSGTTHAQVTNLNLQTIDSAGVVRLYSFNLELTNRQTTNLAIVPAIAGAQSMQLGNNVTVGLDDIERGLAIAIRRGYTSDDDLVVEAVRQMLVQARSHNISLQQAAVQASVPYDVVTSLAEIARSQQLQQVLQDSILD